MRKKLLTEAQVKEVGILYTEKNMSMLQISKWYKVSAQCICDALHKSGVRTRKTGPVTVENVVTIKRKHKYLSSEEISQISVLHQEGNSFAEIGRRFGVSNTTITLWAGKLGIEAWPANKCRKKIQDSDHPIIVDKYNNGELIKPLMGEYKCSYEVIRKILDDNGCYIRRKRGKVGVPEGHVFCSICKETKLKDEFHTIHKTKHNNRGFCILCYRNRRYKQLYGITLSQYDSLLEVQNGSCGICKGPSTPKPTQKDDSYHIDHDHESNKVRGLLCQECNVGLGLFKDSIETFKAAIVYLENPPFNSLKI